MSNVNKVKLLSERTSGVPPVIFYSGSRCPKITKHCYNQDLIADTNALHECNIDIVHIMQRPA